MNKPKVYVNMVVRDDENYVGYALRSVYDYVDGIMIIDTGSTDDTISKIEATPDPLGKISFKVKPCKIDSDEVTTCRQELLTKTLNAGADWMMLLDGDEVWFQKDIQFIVNNVLTNMDNGMVSIGTYRVIGDNIIDKSYTFDIMWPHDYIQDGWKEARFFNLKTISGIHWNFPYLKECLTDGKDRKLVSSYNNYIVRDRRFFHFDYNRSRNDGLYNRRAIQHYSKRGKLDPLELPVSYPEVFSEGL